jgi:hypothetical protein
MECELVPICDRDIQITVHAVAQRSQLGTLAVFISDSQQLEVALRGRIAMTRACKRLTMRKNRAIRRLC